MMSATQNDPLKDVSAFSTGKEREVSTAQMKTGKSAYREALKEKYAKIAQKVIPVVSGSVSGQKVIPGQNPSATTKTGLKSTFKNAKDSTNTLKKAKEGVSPMNLAGKVVFVAGVAWSITENVLDVYKRGSKGNEFVGKALVGVAVDVSGASSVVDGSKYVDDKVDDKVEAKSGGPESGITPLQKNIEKVKNSGPTVRKKKTIRNYTILS
jgi:hypothetical protein